MVPGFNHNIKHKGRIFHVQTEDSGPKNPHIITHLFVGGNIVASKKTQYADIVGQHDYERTVRSMMEEQHKQMLRNLVNGAFDSVETAPAYHLDGPPPMNFTAVSPTTTAMAGGSAFSGLPSQARAATVADTRPAGGVPEPAAPQAGAAPPAASLEPREPRQTTIFGEDLISEKSLDEVILSYLAEDLADLD